MVPSVTHTNFAVLFETDKDDEKIVICTIKVSSYTSETFYFNQVYHTEHALDGDNFLIYDGEFYPKLVGSRETTDGTSELRVFGYYMNIGSGLQIPSTFTLKNLAGLHVIGSIVVQDPYLHVFSTGPCEGSTSMGLVVTRIDVSQELYDLDCVICIPFDGISVNLGFESSQVSQAVTFD